MSVKPAARSSGDTRDKGGTVEVASALGDRSILAVVSGVKLRDGSRVRGWLAGRGKRRRVTGSRIALSANGSGRRAELLILSAGGRGNSVTLDSTLVLEAANDEVELRPRLSEAATPVGQLGADHLAKLDDATRIALLNDVAALVGSTTASGSSPTASEMRALRDALRPRLPAAAVDPEAAYVPQVDGLWRIGPSAFYIKGWIFDRDFGSDYLRIVTPEGRPIDLHGRLFRYPRPDVTDYFGCGPREKLGFIAYFETPTASPLGSGWILEGGESEGRRVEVEVSDVIDDVSAARTLLFRDLAAERLPADELRANHIKPALGALEERRLANIEIEAVDQYGRPHEQPAVTLVVPLYRRMEFVEQQMAQFVHDPQMHEADLIYVLDSPEDADYLRLVAEQLLPLYGVPFRVVTLTANGGFAVANNVGASLARARMLVLLNSDVLPAAPGWLLEMTRFYDATPNIGAVGPKLLYEDDSIQHAGMYFGRPPGEHVWTNEHFFKGLHRDFAKANIARRVPAVTGACLMTETALYQDLGGLSGAFVRGDYEDSDLCLRLAQVGRETWYLPSVELYHLEGQSYPSEERALASEYNRWLHTHLWSEELAAHGHDSATGAR